MKLSKKVDDNHPNHLISFQDYDPTDVVKPQVPQVLSIGWVKIPEWKVLLNRSRTERKDFLRAAATVLQIQIQSASSTLRESLTSSETSAVSNLMMLIEYHGHEPQAVSFLERILH